MASLAQRAVRGAAWAVGAGLLSRACGLIGTLVIARYLAPDVMGEVTSAAVLAFAASWVTHLGLAQYVLVRADQGPGPVFHATVIGLAFAAVALCAVAASASVLGAWLEAPGLAEYLPGLALAVFIRRIASTPDKLLLRRMRFRTLALAAAAGEVAYSGVAVTLVVVADLGGHGIVIGNIVQSLVVTGITVAACGVRDWLTPMRLRWDLCRDALRFGAPLGVENVLYEAARYGDKLVFTRLFGPARTGEYNLAYNLADLPSVYIGEQVSNVLLPTLMRVREEARTGVLVRAIGMLTLVTAPMAIGLAVIAPTLVDVLLPEQWQGVAPFLTILASVSLFRPINGLISHYLILIERGRVLMNLETARVATLFGGLLLLGLAGPLLAAAAVGISSLAHTCLLVRAIHGDGSFLRALLATLRAPLLAASLMGAGVLLVRGLVGPVSGIGEVALLAGEIASGACIYLSAIFAFGRAAALEALALARGVLRPKPA